MCYGRSIKRNCVSKPKSSSDSVKCKWHSNWNWCARRNRNTCNTNGNWPCSASKSKSITWKCARISRKWCIVWAFNRHTQRLTCNTRQAHRSSPEEWKMTRRRRIWCRQIWTTMDRALHYPAIMLNRRRCNDIPFQRSSQFIRAAHQLQSQCTQWLSHIPIKSICPTTCCQTCSS